MLMKRKIKILIDIAMIIMLPVLMAYLLVGEKIHEWVGTVMFFLFISHHILNYYWLKNITKGRYDKIRILRTIINACLMIIMLMLVISGVVMSKYVFVELPFGGGIGKVRLIHLLASHWGLVLMSLHLGLHWSIFMEIAKKRIGKRTVHLSIMRVTAIIIFVYGIYAFHKRQVGSYLFLTNQFVFFDRNEPLQYFFLDYLGIMGVFTCLGYYLTKILKKTRIRMSETIND